MNAFSELAFLDPLFLLTRKSKVLLVEDDTQYRTLLRSLIQAIDPRAEVETFTSAEDARGQLDRDLGYSLIVADHLLQGDATGADLWNYCRSTVPWVPFLLLSGRPADEVFDGVVRRSERPPYLAKPFIIHDCRRVLRELLKQEAI